MIISIDHGNKYVKSQHSTFNSGIYSSDNRPPFGDSLLYFKGKYYSISDDRIPYMRDKTKDDRFFILTLIAIANEIDSAGVYSADDIIDIKLNVGLPPSHYSGLYEKFEAYFLRGHDIIDFEYKDKPYSIYISEVNAYPQAYAAAMTVFNTIKSLPKVLIVDIGGFTADYLVIKKGQADLSVCDSLEHGVILLYNSIKSKVNSDYDMLIDESDIDGIINDAVIGEASHGFENGIVRLVNKMSEEFIDKLFGDLRERMIDMKVGKTLFVDGGSILLRKYIERNPRSSNAVVIDDIAANLKGYDLLYKASHRR